MRLIGTVTDIPFHHCNKSREDVLQVSDNRLPFLGDAGGCLGCLVSD